MRTPTGDAKHECGHSLIQALVCLAILATLSVQALVMATGWIQAQRSDAMAKKLRNAFVFARSEALSSRVEHRISFFNSTSGSCLVVYSSTASTRCTCNSNGQAVCAAGAVARLVEVLPHSTGIQLSSNSASVGIEPRSGLVTPTVSVDLRPTIAPPTRHIVNISGRLRTCSPDGKAARFVHC